MASNHIRNIAIVGATGQSGSHITASLLKNPSFTVTALTRSADTSSFPPGLKAIPVDYSDPSTLVSALKNQDALVITLGVTAPPDTHSKLTRAAAEAGVKWIVPNEFGGDTDAASADDTGLGAPKRAERKLIEKLGVSSWIGVATGFWYEYSLSGPGLYGIDIKKREVVLFDDATQRLNTSTWPQVGRGVAALLALPIEGQGVTLSGYKNRFAFISSFAVNQREMLDSLNRVLGLEDGDWNISRIGAKQRFEESKKQMAEGNRMGFAYMLYTRYFFPGEDASLYEKTKGLDNEKLGLPVEDLDEATKVAVKMADEDYFLKTMARRR